MEAARPPFTQGFWVKQGPGREVTVTYSESCASGPPYAAPWSQHLIPVLSTAWGGWLAMVRVRAPSHGHFLPHRCPAGHPPSPRLSSQSVWCLPQTEGPGPRLDTRSPPQA